MQDITEEDVRSVFDEKTFSRGYGYYTGHHVETALKTGNILTGRVAGTQESPYKVEVTITNTITSHCTCPVGYMCKHGAALLLQWVHNKESIIDIDQLMIWLKKRDKEELITIIHSMIENSPYLAQGIVSFQKVKENTIDMDEISKILHTDIMYYSLPEKIESFEKAEKIALMLIEEQQFKKAAEIYLLLVEKGVDILYTYDTGDHFCDKFLEYVGTFVNISKKLNTVNNDVIHKIIDVIEAEDYGFGVDEMLHSIATKENVSLIEEDIFNRIARKNNEYVRGKLLNVLTDVYNTLGMHKDSIRIIEKAGLRNSKDYLRMGVALLGQKNYEKALSYVREGLAKGGGAPLGELYFDIVSFLPKEELVKIDKEAMTIALQVISSYSYSILNRSPEIYFNIKSVFTTMGKYEEFISNIKKKCEPEIVLAVLLHEDHIEEAIECALSSQLDFHTVLHIAEIAQKTGHKESALKLILKVLNLKADPFYSFNKELITFFVIESSDSELKKGIDTITNRTAKMFIEPLLERNQEYAVQMIKRIIGNISKEEIIHYAKNLENEYAKDICQLWASKYVNRSHVYYNGVIDVLKILKGILNKKEWAEYILNFAEKNKGKKKFMKQFRIHFSDIPL